MADLQDDLASSQAIERLLEERSRAGHMLRRLRDEAPPRSEDDNSAEFASEEILIQKAGLIADGLRVGRLNTTEEVSESLNAIAVKFESRIVSPTTQNEFDLALTQVTGKAADSSDRVVELLEQFEQKQRLKPLLEEFVTLLSSLASANHERPIQARES